MNRMNEYQIGRESRDAEVADHIHQIGVLQQANQELQKRVEELEKALEDEQDEALEFFNSIAPSVPASSTPEEKRSCENCECSGACMRPCKNFSHWEPKGKHSCKTCAKMIDCGSAFTGKLKNCWQPIEKQGETARSCENCGKASDFKSAGIGCFGLCKNKSLWQPIAPAPAGKEMK